jgi:APA family basic amino acid/polyamine antiporter
MTKLKRALGLFEATLIGVGIILGAGIYVLIGEAAGLAGNALWLSFVVVGIACILTGLSYAELSSIFPRAGAEYIYIEKTFNKKLAWFIGYLLILSGIIGSATVAIGFANYFTALFTTPKLLTALTLLVICSGILLIGIKESAILEVIFTLIEVLGLVIIIFIGLPYLGTINYFELAKGITGIFEGAALIFFAYIGFESIARLAEETRNPTRTIPRAIVLSITITTILYILVAISAVSVLGWEKLSMSDAPLAAIASHLFGEKAFTILAVIALFATFNTVLAIMLTTIRLMYGMASVHSLPSLLEKVSRGTKVPWTATIFVGIISMIFVFFENIRTVASMTNFVTLVTFALVNTSVIVLRYRGTKGKFKTPITIHRIPLLPLLGLLSCIFMLTHIEINAVIYSIILTIIGMFIYEILKKTKMIRT